MRSDGRRTGVVALALAATVAVAGCGVARAHMRTPAPTRALGPGGEAAAARAGAQVTAAALGRRGHRVPPGVTIAGLPAGGLTAAEARTLLTRLAHEVDQPAEDAHLDPATGGAVPGVDGVRLDVEATLGRLLAAPPRSAVRPVLLPVAPAVSLRDLPPRPVYHGPRSRYEVAFVINVAWGEEYLEAILRALQEARAPATFCLVARWAEAHPEAVRQIVAAGAAAHTPYTFCNHGDRERTWRGLDEAQAAAHIAQADRVIERLTGRRPLYFSPHRGEFDDALLRASRAEGHELVLWSVDTIDWRADATPQRVLERVVRRAAPGDIVLLHPTHPTAEALAGMIACVRAKGLRLVTLDQLLSPAAPAAPPPAAG